LLCLFAGYSIATITASASAETIDVSQLQWSVASLIDQSRNPYSESQPATLPGQYFSPRDTRGMGISPDGRYLYLGYNNSQVRNDAGVLLTENNGEVRRVDLTATGPARFDTQWNGRELGNRGKAIGVDDVGRVYLADTDRIDIYNADLSTKLFTINRPLGSMQWEGVAVTREAGGLMLYVSDRANGTLSKAQLTESGATITGATPDATFGVGGILPIALGTASLRNVEVDGTGNVWVAGRDSNLLYRVSPDGSVVQSAATTNPFDIGFNGTQVFVTHQNQRDISVFDISQFENNTIPVSGIAPPWATLAIDANGNEETGKPGLLSGIVVLPGQGFYVGNEHGQTEGQKSLYGVTDSYSGTVGGIFYQDSQFDDNDPVFLASLPAVPEPAAYLLALTGLVAFGGYARRQKQRAAS
jgi:hypothetical protein